MRLPLTLSGRVGNFVGSGTGRLNSICVVTAENTARQPPRTQCPLATLPFSPPWRDSSHSLSAHICLPLRPCTRSSEPDGGGSDPDRNRPPSPTETQIHKPLSNQPQHSQSGGRVWQIHLDEHIRSRINQSIATDCRGILATYAFVNCAENVDKGVRG